MSGFLPPTIAVILPLHEEFGPRRTRGIGLTVRQHAISTSAHRSVVFGPDQHGPIFLDVTFRRVHPRWFAVWSKRARYVLGLIRQLQPLRPAAIEVHADADIAVWLQKQFPTVPVVLVLHDDPLKDKLLRAPARRAALIGRVARIEVPSAWMRDRFLADIPQPARPPVVVPPAGDMEPLPPSVTALDVVGIPLAKRRTRLVLFVGRLIAEKGAELFVAACASALPHLPGWRAEAIGGPDHKPKTPDTPFVAALRIAAETAGIGLLGYRDLPDVMAGMARSAIVAIPSREPEPGGRIVLEAMANGAAVICANTGAFPEVGGDAVLYFDPDKPEDLAAAIRAAASDPARLAAMGEAGRQRARFYDLPRIGRLIDTVRLQVISDGPLREPKQAAALPAWRRRRSMV